MPEVADGSYDVIIDKGTCCSRGSLLYGWLDWLLVVFSVGTLDAIASSTSTADGERRCLEDSCNYMREMWRILKTDGLLVIVTTMDASLFESIALIPMVGSASIDAVQEASNWKRGSRIDRVRTSEGGQVYYYSIRKLKSILVGSATVNKGSSSSDGKEGLFRGIQLLLDEAMKAKEEMGAVADSQVLIMMVINDGDYDDDYDDH